MVEVPTYEEFLALIERLEKLEGSFFKLKSELLRLAEVLKGETDVLIGKLEEIS